MSSAARGTTLVVHMPTTNEKIPLNPNRGLLEFDHCSITERVEIADISAKPNGAHKNFRPDSWSADGPVKKNFLLSSVGGGATAFGHNLFWTGLLRSRMAEMLSAYPFSMEGRAEVNFRTSHPQSDSMMNDRLPQSGVNRGSRRANSSVNHGCHLDVTNEDNSTTVEYLYHGRNPSHDPRLVRGATANKRVQQCASHSNSMPIAREGSHIGCSWSSWSVWPLEFLLKGRSRNSTTVLGSREMKSCVAIDLPSALFTEGETTEKHLIQRMWGQSSKKATEDLQKLLPVEPRSLSYLADPFLETVVHNMKMFENCIGDYSVLHKRMINLLQQGFHPAAIGKEVVLEDLWQTSLLRSMEKKEPMLHKVAGIVSGGMRAMFPQADSSADSCLTSATGTESLNTTTSPPRSAGGCPMFRGRQSEKNEASMLGSHCTALNEKVFQRLCRGRPEQNQRVADDVARSFLGPCAHFALMQQQLCRHSSAVRQEHILRRFFVPFDFVPFAQALRAKYAHVNHNRRLIPSDENPTRRSTQNLI